MAELILRPLAAADEAAARQANAELAVEGFEFLLRFRANEPWSMYLARLARFRAGVDLRAGIVPATFLVAEVDGVLIGRLDVRHELNERLRLLGGHLGYAVRPAHRRLGHATRILAQGLHLAAGLGIDPALLTCDDDNAGSIRTIEGCGGVLRDVLPAGDGPVKRRYWVSTGSVACSDSAAR